DACQVRFGDANLVLVGGNPGGRDEVHSTVTSWPGWRRMPGWADFLGKRVSKFTAPPNPSAALAVLACKTLKLDWEPEALEFCQLWARKLARVKGLLTDPVSLLPGGLVEFPSERRPMPHQAAALLAIEQLDYRTLLADDMGLGKTATALWACHTALFNPRRLLVICPVSVKWNWERELNERLAGWTSIVLDDTAKQRSNLLADNDALDKSSQRHALILNYDIIVGMSDAQLDK